MLSVAKQIIIDSKDRASYSTGSHDFYIELKELCEGRYKVQYVYIPNTFYNITASNCVFYFNDGTDRNCSIAAGNYTASNLATALTTALNASGTSITFAVTYSTSTLKMTVSGNSNFTLKFGSYSTNSIASMIGFASSDSGVAAGSFVGANVVDLSYPRCILVDINQTPKVASTSNAVGTVAIPLDVLSSDIATFKSESDYDLFLTLPRTNRLQFMIRDDRGQALNLNGADWYLILRRCNE
jgi:hypothetical protein